MLTRADVIAKIEERLSGTLSDADLAAWAFDRFYAEELGEEAFTPADAELIADVLDELMFADEETFVLGADALRSLVGRLQHP